MYQQNGDREMQNTYIVDVTYSTGEVALYGPFNVRANHLEQRAIDFVAKLKNAPNSMVVEAKIRILNKP